MLHQPPVPSLAAAKRTVSPYVAADNAASLDVIAELWSAVAACESQSAPYLNTAAVFFHDLAQILSGLLLRVREVQGPYRPSDRQLGSVQVGFPYVGFSDVVASLNPSTKDYLLHAKGLTTRRRMVSHLASVHLGRGPTLVLGSSCGWPLGRLWRELIPASARVLLPHPIPLFIPELPRHMAILASHVEALLERHGLAAWARPLCDVIRRHIEAFAAPGSGPSTSWDALITGSLGIRANRLLAAHARAQGVPVVSLLHGEHDGDLDEPVFGYAERTYCTHLLGYGPAGGQLHAAGVHVRCGYDVPHYHESSSDTVRTLFTSPEVPAPGDLSRKRLLYVPTSFSGTRRYGPFRDLPDALYLAWQDALIAAFPDLIWKGHSKDGQDIVPAGARFQTRRPLPGCLDEGDVLLFDYVSSALALAIATTKPIIFFDLGLRHLAPGALERIQQRCVYVPVDPERPGDLRALLAGAALDRSRFNTFSDEYSLARSDAASSRLETLRRLVRRVMT